MAWPEQVRLKLSEKAKNVYSRANSKVWMVFHSAAIAMEQLLQCNVKFFIDVTTKVNS
jgi:hypothetical protein